MALWHDGERWESLNSSQFFGRGNEKRFQTHVGGLEQRNSNFEFLGTPLLMLSTSPDPYNSMAIAVYSPNSSRNSYQAIGRFIPDGEIKYSEDRRLFSEMQFSHVIPQQIGIRTRYSITGLMAPNRAKHDHIEGLRHESYILYGRPFDILQAIENLD